MTKRTIIGHFVIILMRSTISKMVMTRILPNDQDYKNEIILAIDKWVYYFKSKNFTVNFTEYSTYSYQENKSQALSWRDGVSNILYLYQRFVRGSKRWPVSDAVLQKGELLFGKPNSRTQNKCTIARQTIEQSLKARMKQSSKCKTCSSYSKLPVNCNLHDHLIKVHPYNHTLLLNDVLK